MSDLERIKITTAEVTDTRVDELVQKDREARRPAAPANREPPKVPFYYNPIYVYTFFGGLAAFIVSMCFEPFINEGNAHKDAETGLALLALFPCIGGAVGLFIAMSDGLLSRNISRAGLCGAIGLGVGLLAGGIGLIAGSIVYVIIGMIAVNFMKPGQTTPTGIALFLQIVARAMGWTFASTGMGLGQGIALKSKKLVLNGLVGGILGGFVGGLAFDPIALALSGGSLEPGSGTGAMSRVFGFTVIGTAVGFFMGLVENMAKDAWLYMKAGPLAGKQFVIYKDPTVLGSSPKCEIYLFKDAAIEPNHAQLSAVGLRYQLKDLGSRQGTFVNGRKIETHMLEPGDTVVLGETVLEYAERERK